MKMKSLLKLIFPAFLVAVSQTAHAVCPVCVVAVGAGVGFSRWLGVDDTITGIWIGGLTLAIALWTVDWLKRKNFNFPGRKSLTIIAYYVLVYVSLVWTDIVGHPLNKIWGYDKIFIGIVVGTIFFIIGNASYLYLKKKNNDHAYFPFQKVAMPVGALIIANIIFYIITK